MGTKAISAEPGWEGIRLPSDTLVGKGWREGDDLFYHEMAGAEHTEAAGSARLGDVLKWTGGRK